MIFIISTGQCGSRVLTQMYMQMGYACDAEKTGLDSAFLAQYRVYGLEPDRPLDEADIQAVQEHLSDKQNYVFKALATLRFAPYVDAEMVAIYRHPALWKQAVDYKRKVRLYEWWIRYHEKLLDLWKANPFPLFDFSDGFEADLQKHFGWSNFRNEKVRQRGVEYEAPADAMRVYEKLTGARCAG